MQVCQTLLLKCEYQMKETARGDHEHLTLILYELHEQYLGILVNYSSAQKCAFECQLQQYTKR